MKLWLLELKRWVEYQGMQSCVVRAESEASAREIAAKGFLDRQSEEILGGEAEEWLDENQSTIRELIADGQAEVLHQYCAP